MVTRNKVYLLGSSISRVDREEVRVRTHEVVAHARDEERRCVCMLGVLDGLDFIWVKVRTTRDRHSEHPLENVLYPPAQVGHHVAKVGKELRDARERRVQDHARHHLVLQILVQQSSRRAHRSAPENYVVDAARGA
eukprot:CAMPEP_0119491072 /NCGR_PEP_ID=MMETSP1344-20130328/16059_1 /TAXON_ID=236787 /ORGANISM="Florenciella parvula, Strain CCMP2471" /LENGTH=135 /DNA_ID=CAMNT_0007526295 /DNA_START=280 /DNA_END=687 /DNA_ORIENTATION=+